MVVVYYRSGWDILKRSRRERNDKRREIRGFFVLTGVATAAVR